MSRKIYLSPSDQTGNRYAWGNTNEAEQCRKMAAATAQVLERCGFMAKTNLRDEMEQRVEESNTWGAQVHLCIHTNAFNGQVTGTRLFCYDLEGEGAQLCRAVLDTLAPLTPGESDGISARPELYEVRNANAPTLYLEVGFHDNPQEAEWLVNNTETVAEGIARGLCGYYGVPYVQPRAADGRFQQLEEVPAFGRSAVEKLIRRGWLNGTGTGLDLSMDMVRIFAIHDRAGLYDLL